MHSAFRRPFLLLIDLGLVALATALAMVLRDNFDISLDRMMGLLPYLLITLTTAAIVLAVSGLSRSIWRFSAMSDYLRVLMSVCVIVLTSVAVGFLVNRLDAVARALPVVQGLLMAFLLIGVRVAMRLRHARRRQPVNSHISLGAEVTVLAVGLNVITELFLRSVAEFGDERIEVAGIVGRSERHSGRLFQQYPILGVPEDIQSVLKQLEVHGVFVDRLVVTTPFSHLSAAAQQALLEVEKRSDIRLDLFAERIGLDVHARRDPGGGGKADSSLDRPLTFSVTDLEKILARPYWHVKRACNVSAAFLLLVLTAPLFVLLALLVVMDIGFPAVFWQQRPGLRGRHFKLYKFRTMGSAHDQSGVRIPDDRRASPIGRFLRRTRLDELPQIFNILIGEMSFIGPRPLLAVDQSSSFAARLLVRPGLTGWAQVSGGRAVCPRDKAALDVWYVRSASLWLDLRILARTLQMILLGERTDPASVRRAWEDLTRSRLLVAAESDTALRPPVVARRQAA